MTTSEIAAQKLRRRRRVIASLAGPIAILALIVYILVHHASEFRQAVDRTGAGTLVLVTLLGLMTLLARSEAVVTCLAAMEDRPRRRDIHAANSLTFVAMSVTHYLASPVRAALLKRIDRERAPTLAQMIMVDASTTLIEATLVVVVIIASAGTLKLPWWASIAVVLAAAAGIGVAFAARARFHAHPAIRGLAVLVHSRRRLLVAGLMVIVIVTQITRTLIVLRATGLHPTVLEAAATFVAAGTLSTLFAGPSAGTAGAPLIVFGHDGLGAAAAAGLILSATAIAAAFLYAAAGAPFLVARLRSASPAPPSAVSS